MSAQIIPFPRRAVAVAPALWDWLQARLGCRKCCLVKRRTPTFKGVPWAPGTVLLLHREYDALVAEYEAQFGIRVR